MTTEMFETEKSEKTETATLFLLVYSIAAIVFALALLAVR